MNENAYRIAVFGAGGVGGYFGGRLAYAGCDVTFIARGAHLQALQQHGLHVASPKGDFHVSAVRATDAPGTIEPVDAVLVATKTWQVPEAAEAMRPLVGPETLIVPLLNGVEAPSQLAAVLGADGVTGGLCRIISYVEAPGRIRHLGAEPAIEFGPLSGVPDTRMLHLRDVMRDAGFVADIPADIEAAMWRKFLLVAAWSGVGTMTRAPLGIFRREPETRELLRQTMAEVQAVASARGVPLPVDIVDKTLAFLDTLTSDGTASMQRDIIAGRPSELEAQNGAVVRLGRDAGVDTPVNQVIYYSLLPLERRARNLLSFDIES